MNTIIAFLAFAIATVSASGIYGNGYGARGAHYNFDGHVRYFNDHSGNTVPVMAKDQNNDGVNDRHDSNRDGKVDSYHHGHHGYNTGYGGGYHGGYGGHQNAYGLGNAHGLHGSGIYNSYGH